jgi:hypothetical protein
MVEKSKKNPRGRIRIWNNFHYWKFISNAMDFELEQGFFSKFEIQKAGYLSNLMQLLQIHYCPNLDKE